jgi:hypothetical protein
VILRRPNKNHGVLCSSLLCVCLLVCHCSSYRVPVTVCAVSVSAVIGTVLGVTMEMKSVVYEPYVFVHVLMQNFLGTTFQFPLNMIIHKSLLF